MTPALVPQALYWLRSGAIVRYLGPSGGWGAGDVLRPIGRPLSRSDARALRVIYAQLVVRGMWPAADWIREVMRELAIEPHTPYCLPPKEIP